jgi:thioredoxin-related protein
MNKLIWIVLLIFSSSQSLALRSEKALSYSLENDLWIAKLSEGFHFNEKAPNGMQTQSQMLKPNVLEPNKIVFKSPDVKSAIARLYVCDDAVTFCEVITVNVNSEINSKFKILNEGKTKSKSAYGFNTDLQQALEQAKKSNQLVMIDFSARWCPGCQRMETDIFTKQKFKKQTDKIVKVKIDTDMYENSVLAEKYQILGVPTVIFLNSQGQEILRLLDYVSAEVFYKSLKSVQKDPRSFNNLIEVAEQSKDPKELYRLGQRFFWGGQFENAVKALSKVSPAPIELNAADFYHHQNLFNKKQIDQKTYAQKLLTLLGLESQSTRSIVWRTELFATEFLNPDEQNKLLESGTRIFETAMKSSKDFKRLSEGDVFGDLVGYEKLSLAMNYADLIETGQKDPVATKAAWTRAAQIGEKLKIPNREIGPSVRFLSALVAAEEWVKAHKLVLALKKSDPKNGDLLRRELKILVGLKDYESAKKIGELALQDSYGRNHVWVVENLAKAYGESGAKDRAIKILDDYLLKPELDLKMLKSTKTALEKLKSQYSQQPKL